MNGGKIMCRRLYVALFLWLASLLGVCAQGGERFDTCYVAGVATDFCLRPEFSTSFGEYSFTADEGRYSLLSEPIFKLGVTLSYKWLSAGVKREVLPLLGGSPTGNNEYSLAFNGRLVGLDAVYSQSGRYRLRDADGNIIKKGLECFSSSRLSLGAYFVFNNRRFSYPAVAGQNFRQKASCGSVVAAVLYNYEKLRLDADKYAQEFSLPSPVPSSELRYRAWYLSCGYAYNWVFRGGWLLHGTLLPAVSVVRSASVERGGVSDDCRIDNFDFACTVRLGVVWNGNRHFAGFNALMDVQNIGGEAMDFSEMYLRTRIFYGVRF